ncbi:hypothetical protein EZV62_012012 [Acer yangbiense]|uniref:Flavin-containing monooxygenase n=1 Tax=Acer yangbiense TaxID=1000413 RepID=A0A5C7I7I9_9ROSI|nr:hypothetical protein EZV62_012012 [Acer yangbiense]
MEKKQIGIIGAGISGLLACKYMLSKGFDPIVFEAKSDVGGVWIKTIASTKLQTLKTMYQFSDFPWPSSVTENFPAQHEVFDYIQSYAQHFDLIKHIRFNTKVVGIEYEGLSDEEIQSYSLWNGNGQPFSFKGKWKVVVDNIENNSTKVHKVDFVILCVGRFCDVPNIPEFPPKKGPEAFHGKVIHSMDYAAMDYESAANFVKGKQVIVVGFRKSALDIAMECSEANGLKNQCTVLYRTEQWIGQANLPWGLPLTCLICLNSFCEEGILVDGEPTSTTPLKTDVVILATGFRGDQKLRDIFVSQVFQDYKQGSSDETFPLYREIVHPRIPQLAVIGFSESFSNLHTSEMKCRWLAELLDGTFKLPSIKEMENVMVEWDEHLKRSSGEHYRRSCIALPIWYNDQLCKDMGWNPKRKKGFFAELFEPYEPLDYVSPSRSN